MKVDNADLRYVWSFAVLHNSKKDDAIRDICHAAVMLEVSPKKKKDRDSDMKLPFFCPNLDIISVPLSFMYLSFNYVHYCEKGNA